MGIIIKFCENVDCSYACGGPASEEEFCPKCGGLMISYSAINTKFNEGRMKEEKNENNI